MSRIVGLRSAQTLGLLGLLPFFALSALAWVPLDATIGDWPIAKLSRACLVAYSAVILSFLGAVHWGFALSAPDLPHSVLRQSLLWGVTPALLGWLAMVMMFVNVWPWLVLAFLIGDLLLARVVDGALCPHYPSAPAGYLELRTRLTAGASLALAVALAASL